MNRAEAERYIAEKYSVLPEYPWMTSPDHAVFRHRENRKWFAIIMHIAGNKLGLSSEMMMDIMNVKCDQLLIGSLLGQKGFFPAYHMNKLNWISIALDGSAEDETIKWLIDMSFAATVQKPQKRKSKGETRTERISRMEHYFDTLCHAVSSGTESFTSNPSLQSMLKDLTSYYEKGEWLADYEADERGELPSELKRGVLSQDGVYNLLFEIKQGEKEDL